MRLHHRTPLHLLLLFLLPSPLCQAQSPFVVRRGSSLVQNEETFSFSGVNIYWLGQDENNPDVPEGPSPHYSHPSLFRIDDVLTSAKSMGALVVRSHTLGQLMTINNDLELELMVGSSRNIYRDWRLPRLPQWLERNSPA